MASIFDPGGGVRKIKTGWEEIDLFAFLTTDPGRACEVGPSEGDAGCFEYAEDQNLWMQGYWREVTHLQSVEATKTQFMRFSRDRMQSA